MRSREKMRPQAGGGKLKHAPPMRVNDLPVVAQAVPPASYIFSQLLSRRAQARLPAVSRLVSTPVRWRGTASQARVGKSARATSSEERRRQPAPPS